ncbi:MAG TPA: 50S ribosomal protein L18 [Bdellovibrionota bacterium]|nr:50S ribosomal protein L18 [Bdellovibrionota bacterium]
MSKKLTKRTSSKVTTRAKRHLRIRKGVIGSAERPRLSVVRSNRSVQVQLIDDASGKTLASAVTPKGKTANRELAKALGKDLAAKASAQGISSIVFDRSGYLYHGRIAALAEGAREGGLKF